MSSHFKGLGGLLNITCTTEEYTAILGGGSTSFELTPVYAGCKSGTRGVTITHNECRYRFFNATDTLSETTTLDEWRLTSSLVCSNNNKVEIHIYNNDSHASGTWCTLTFFPEDNANLEGLTATIQTNTPLSPNDITVDGSITVRSQTHGTCSAGLTVKTNSTLEVTGVTITGKDELGTDVSVDIG